MTMEIGVDVTRHTTASLHQIGQRFRESNGREYRYVRAGAAIALGDCLIWDAAEEAYAHTPCTALDQVPSGFWPAEGGRTAILDNEYFWMLIAGDALVKAAATVVAGAAFAPTGTAGTVDDIAAAAGNASAAASGRGGIFLTTSSGGLARIEVTN